MERDFNNSKKDLFNKMIGNISELNDPANFANRNGRYPNAIAIKKQNAYSFFDDSYEFWKRIIDRFSVFLQRKSAS